ncbi:hypothetical protein LBMAG33_4830 [Candidatus Levyibacteriota bacterium]|nr:heavy-metal-associated domain-containing protein [Candidatus Levybacteria bacterium]GDX62173.1 hypothetical protein LBMAG33_4830 [Candidatus Levybacteria bacterium]
MKLNIFGMDCVSCAMNIDEEIEKIDGVKESNTNYAKQQIEIAFDSKKVSIDKIISAVKKVDEKYDVRIIDDKE